MRQVRWISVIIHAVVVLLLYCGGGYAAPDPPILIYPEDGAEIPFRAVYLAYDSRGDIYHLQVQVDDNKDFLSPKEYITYLNICPVMADRYTYWRVRAHGPDGASEWSEARKFHTFNDRWMDFCERIDPKDNTGRYDATITHHKRNDSTPTLNGKRSDGKNVLKIDWALLSDWHEHWIAGPWANMHMWVFPEEDYEEAIHIADTYEQFDHNQPAHTNDTVLYGKYAADLNSSKCEWYDTRDDGMPIQLVSYDDFVIWDWDDWLPEVSAVYVFFWEGDDASDDDAILIHKVYRYETLCRTHPGHVMRDWNGFPPEIAARYITYPDCRDADGDCLCNPDDNCPEEHNPRQENDDGDPWGNVCDGCPKLWNYLDTDRDGNGRWDECDPGVMNVDEIEQEGEQDLGIVTIDDVLLVHGSMKATDICGTKWKAKYDVSRDTDRFVAKTAPPTKCPVQWHLNLDLGWECPDIPKWATDGYYTIRLYEWRDDESKWEKIGQSEKSGTHKQALETTCTIRPPYCDVKPDRLYRVEVQSKGCSSPGNYTLSINIGGKSLKCAHDFDRDKDGLTNEDEMSRGTDPDDPDTDGDDLEDGDEVLVYSTDPLSNDTDGDGLDDGAEKSLWGESWQKDLDNDNLINLVDPDADGDGLADGQEAKEFGTDPKLADTDADGLSDGREHALIASGYDVDPLNRDSDGDGLSDGEEVDGYRTLPWKSDTDGDRIGDGREVEVGTDPSLPDTDCDGVGDGEEIESNRDPLRVQPDAGGDPILREDFEFHDDDRFEFIGYACWSVESDERVRFTIAGSDEKVHKGSLAAKLALNSSPGSVAFVHKPFEIEPAAYTLSAWVFADAAAMVRLSAMDREGEPNQKIGEWERLELDFSVGDATTLPGLGVELIGEGIVHLDALQLTLVGETVGASGGRANELPLNTQSLMMDSDDVEHEAERAEWLVPLLITIIILVFIGYKAFSRQ